MSCCTVNLAVGGLPAKFQWVISCHGHLFVFLLTCTATCTPEFLSIQEFLPYSHLLRSNWSLSEDMQVRGWVWCAHLGTGSEVFWPKNMYMPWCTVNLGVGWSPAEFWWVLSYHSRWSRDAMQHQSTWTYLVWLMGCRLFVTKPISQPILTFCNLDSQKQIAKLQLNYKIFIQETAFANAICKMLAILFWTQYVNLFKYIQYYAHTASCISTSHKICTLFCYPFCYQTYVIYENMWNISHIF